MGNYNFRANNPNRDEVVLIKQSKFTSDKEMNSKVLRDGSKAKVIKSGQLYQSRPNAPKIDYSTVMFQNGDVDAYLSINIQRRGQ